MPAETAADCPNCHTDDDDETDCLHHLAGDECPECGNELVKPTAGKVECPHCYYVVNGQYGGMELRDFSLTYRQALRLLELFGYDRPTTPGNAGNTLRRFCNDHDVSRDDLNDFLEDLRRRGAYGTGGDGV